MFNTTIHKTETNPVTRVIEKSITPNKVVEMYDKTKDQIDRETSSRLLIESNIVTGIVTQRVDGMTRAIEVQTAFKLNGELFERSVIFTQRELFSTDELAKKLFEHYKDEVSKILLTTAFSATDIFKKKV